MSAKLLSPAQVAEIVGLSRAAVYRAIERGDLEASELVHGRLRIEPAEVEAWKQRTRVQPIRARRRKAPTAAPAPPDGTSFRDMAKRSREAA